MRNRSSRSRPEPLGPESTGAQRLTATAQQRSKQCAAALRSVQRFRAVSRSSSPGGGCRPPPGSPPTNAS
eukprot:7970415-Alexandrium_andersonii.AAC.1